MFLLICIFYIRLEILYFTPYRMHSLSVNIATYVAGSLFTMTRKELYWSLSISRITAISTLRFVSFDFEFELHPIIDIIFCTRNSI